jgi:hypothetical protein
METKRFAPAAHELSGQGMGRTRSENSACVRSVGNVQLQDQGLFDSRFDIPTLLSSPSQASKVKELVEFRLCDQMCLFPPNVLTVFCDGNPSRTP